MVFQEVRIFHIFFMQVGFCFRDLTGLDSLDMFSTKVRRQLLSRCDMFSKRLTSND